MFHAVSDKTSSTEATKVYFGKQNFDVCSCMINFWYSFPSSCLSADDELRNTLPRDAVSKLGKGGGPLRDACARRGKFRGGALLKKKFSLFCFILFFFFI